MWYQINPIKIIIKHFAIPVTIIVLNTMYINLNIHVYKGNHTSIIYNVHKFKQRDNLYRQGDNNLYLSHCRVKKNINNCIKMSYLLIHRYYQ